MVPYRESDSPTPVNLRVRLPGPLGIIFACAFLLFSTLWVWVCTAAAAYPDRQSTGGVVLTMVFAIGFVILLAQVVRGGATRYLDVASTAGGAIVGGRHVEIGPDDQVALRLATTTHDLGTTSRWEVRIDGGQAEVLFASVTRELANEVAEAIATVARVEVVRDSADGSATPPVERR